jgi:hypothetical protein
VKAFGRAVPWLLLLLAVADWVGLKAGRLEHPAWLLAVLVGGAVLALGTRLIVATWGMRPGSGRRGHAAGESLLIAGILVALLAGSANWLLGLQGFVVLLEGEAVPLHGGSHLQQFDGGPLARLEEMELALLLEELELVAAGPGSFFPRSHLLVTHSEEAPVMLSLDRNSAGSSGSLRFFQGAFGFAPRIVILKNDEELFDRVVPFTTRTREQAGISFTGTFTIEEEQLHVDGAVELDSLDEGMRGHATLTLSVAREGRMLGRGRLIPGHFAEIDEGYRIGFAGLEKWSEIDVSRRHYGRAVLAGAIVALAGAVLWPVAAWRRR